MRKVLLVIGILGIQLCSLSARVVNVSDYGIVPGQDVSFKVNQLLEELSGETGITLYFPKGNYHFKPENAREAYREVTNHDNSLKRMAFPLFGSEDFVLDGGGSTFVFHGRICPITLEGAKNIMLKNFVIDWDTPFHHELKVVERDEANNSFVAEISPMKYGFEVKGQKLWLGHYNWKDEIGQNIPYDPTTGNPYWDTGRYSLRRTSAKAEKVGENRVLLKNATREVPPVGAILCTYGNGPTSRLAQVIHLANSQDIQIEDVVIHAGGGMGVIAERCENISIKRLTVTSTEERALSARADATHFLGCKGLIQMEDCLLEHMGDDGINVHGAYVKVVEYMGTKTLLCEISHPQQRGFLFCGEGDRIMVTSSKTLAPLFETTVKEVKILNESRFTVTLNDWPEMTPEGPLSLENMTWYPDVVMKNNLIRENRARSVLISTKGSVRIEQNYFSSQMHGVLIEGDNNWWYESGGVRDVVIQNNTFVNIGFGIKNGYPLYVSPLINKKQSLGNEQYHRNVHFNHNHIKSFNGHLAHARSVKGLELIGNTIELDPLYPGGSDLPAIDLDFCTTVRIEENEFSGFTWPIRLERKGETTDVVERCNKGLLP